MIIWDNFKVTDSSPPLRSKVEITAQSRNGTIQTYTIKVSMWCTTSGAWRNDAWNVKITLGDTVITSSLQIKPKTSGTIGTHVYSNSITASINVSGNTGSTTLTVKYADSYNHKTDWPSKSGTLYYDPLPVVYLNMESYTNNSATLSYTYDNIAPTKVDIYVNDVFKQQVTETPFVVTGLSPKTSYTFTGFGYANGAYGTSGDSIVITTYPNPVSVVGVTISDIQPFQAVATVSLSNLTDMEQIEYQLLNASGASVLSTVTTTNTSWNITGLAEETGYQVRARVKTKTSGVWSGYIYSSSFTTLADQASAYIKVNGSWVKGKIYNKINGSWIPAKKTYIKSSGNWVINVNN